MTIVEDFRNFFNEFRQALVGFDKSLRSSTLSNKSCPF